MTDKNLSNCCKKEMKVSFGEEGTNCYICSECLKPCDVWHLVEEETPPPSMPERVKCTCQHRLGSCLEDNCNCKKHYIDPTPCQYCDCSAPVKECGHCQAYCKPLNFPPSSRPNPSEKPKSSSDKGILNNSEAP